jgi:hypothetical protein
VGTNLPDRFSPVPYPSSVSPEQELGFLKEEASIIRKHLNEVETRVKELEGKEN